MTRPSMNVWSMRLAYLVAQRGTCPRRQVGAVLIDQDKRVVATGYNGAPAGLPHCLEVGCLEVDINGKPSCVRVLHAEANALLYAGINASRGCVLYTTTSPCYDCAKEIVQAGVIGVFYHEFYLSRNSQLTQDLFTSAGIEYLQLKEELGAVA